MGHVFTFYITHLKTDCKSLLFIIYKAQNVDILYITNLRSNANLLKSFPLGHSWKGLEFTSFKHTYIEATFKNVCVKTKS